MHSIADFVSNTNYISSGDHRLEGNIAVPAIPGGYVILPHSEDELLKKLGYNINGRYNYVLFVYDCNGSMNLGVWQFRSCPDRNDGLGECEGIEHEAEIGPCQCVIRAAKTHNTKTNNVGTFSITLLNRDIWIQLCVENRKYILDHH